MDFLDLFAIIISSLSLVFSLVAWLFNTSFNNKKEFLKLYHSMINNEEMYLFIRTIEYDQFKKSDISQIDMEKKLDMYLCHIETMIRYSKKDSLKYLKRELFFIKNTDAIWSYVCDLNNSNKIKVFCDLYKLIMDKWSEI